MRKRFLAMLLSISVLLGMMVLPVYAVDSTELSAFEKLCIGIGCIDADEYQPDKSVTRGEFAKIIVNLRGLSSMGSDSTWEESVFGEENDSQTVIIPKDENVFDDVDSSHPDYDAIMAVCNNGYMVGIADRRFAPDFDISVMEAAKVIIDMIGYSSVAAYQGGYPVAYDKIARSLGLFRGISADANVVATQKSVLRLIYNALEVNVVEIGFGADGNYNVTNEIFMNAVLNIHREKGIITDNGITSISTRSGIGAGEIKVGDVVATLPDNLSEYRKLLGRRAELYYRYDEDRDERIVSYINVTSNDESITINADNFVGFNLSTGIFSYTKNSSTASEKISPAANLIYNNQVKTTPYNENDFIFETGEITLCKTGDGDYDLIIINEYKTVYVSSISTADKKIYNGIISTLPGSINYLELTDEVYPDLISIRDKQGNSLSFDNIVKGSVLNVLTYGGSVEIIVSTDRVTDFALSNYDIADSRIRSEWERRIITDGNGEYEVLKSYYSMSNAVPLSGNDIYTLYLDMNGNVAWMDKGVETGKSIGILTLIKYSDDSDFGAVKIYTSAGEMRMFEIPEKYLLNDLKKKRKDIKTDMNEFLGKVILYTLDSDGKIAEFITPAEFADETNRSRGWHYLNEEGKSYYFGTNGKDFDKQFYYVPGTTKVFTTPETYSETDYSDAENFSIGVATFSEGGSGKYTLEAYASSPDAVEAEVIVYRKKIDSGGTVQTHSAFLVEKVYKGLNVDLEIVNYIDGYLMELNVPTASRTTLILSPEVSMLKFSGSSGVGTEINPAGADDERVVGPKSVDDLDAGDIIRYNTNIKGEVDKIAIAYDCDPGYTDDGVKIKGKAFHSGSIYGGSSSDREEYAEGSTYAGDLMTKYGTGIKISTSPTLFPSQINTKEEFTQNVRAFRVSNVPVFIVSEGDRVGSIKVRTGTVDDATAYNDTRSVYDRVVLLGHMTSLIYGAVIYK